MNVRDLVSTAVKTALQNLSQQVLQVSLPNPSILPRNTLYCNITGNKADVIVQIPPSVRNIRYYCDYLSHRDQSYLIERGRWKGNTSIQGITAVGHKFNPGLPSVLIKNSFPYIIFCFHFSHDGYGYSILGRPQLFFSSKPIQTLDDKVKLIILRNVDYRGGICYGYSNHMQTSSSLVEIIDDAISSFFSSAFGYFLDSSLIEKTADFVVNPTIWEEKTLENPNFILENLPGTNVNLFDAAHFSKENLPKEVKNLLNITNIEKIKNQIMLDFESEMKGEHKSDPPKPSDAVQLDYKHKKVRDQLGLQAIKSPKKVREENTKARLNALIEEIRKKQAIIE